VVPWAMMIIEVWQNIADMGLIVISFNIDYPTVKMVSTYS
jgi:hypothetical protein